MADEIHRFQCAIPAGTLAATPAIFPLTMPVRTVDRVDIRVPPGPRGTVGFALGASGLAVLPLEPGTFIVADDETISWDLERQIDSGAWQLLAYNTGTYNHTLYVTFLTRVATANDPLGFLPLDLGSLSAPASARP